MCGSQRCPCGLRPRRSRDFDATGLKISRCSCVNKKQLAAWKTEQNKPQCHINTDCDDGVWCNGVETCASGQCQPGVPRCSRGNQCFEETRSCTTSCEDNDSDGFAAIHCGGNDCDDNDANRSPGNLEVCDAQGIDEDCNPRTVGDLDQDVRRLYFAKVQVDRRTGRIQDTHFITIILHNFRPMP